MSETTSAALSIVIFVVIGTMFTVCAHACDPAEVRGWTQAEPHMLIYLDAHGKHERVSGDRQYRLFECDGKWRYRMIETRQRRKV